MMLSTTTFVFTSCCNIEPSMKRKTSHLEMNVIILSSSQVNVAYQDNVHGCYDTDLSGQVLHRILHDTLF